MALPSAPIAARDALLAPIAARDALLAPIAARDALLAPIAASDAVPGSCGLLSTGFTLFTPMCGSGSPTCKQRERERERA